MHQPKDVCVFLPLTPPPLSLSLACSLVLPPPTQKLRDDQKAVQYTICGCFSLTWTDDGPGGNVIRPHQDYSLDGDKRRISVIETATSTAPIIGQEKLKVSLLPKFLAPRHCGKAHGEPERHPDVVVAHCYAKKQAKLKVREATRFGHAFLGDSWKNMTKFAGESSASFLQRLGTHPKQSFPCESLRISVADDGDNTETARILDHTEMAGMTEKGTSADAVLAEHCSQ